MSVDPGLVVQEVPSLDTTPPWEDVVPPGSPTPEREELEMLRGDCAISKVRESS